MGLLLDSFWRAAAYCLHPRVIALSVLPLVILAAMALGLGYFYWTEAVEGLQAMLQDVSWIAALSIWLADRGWGGMTDLLAPLLLVAFAMPLLVMAALLVVAVFMTPALMALVAQRRFPDLERKKGGSFLASLVWALLSTALALVALVVSVPLWFIPPLVLVLPPLIWGWLTYRVMAFDALADHASKEERQQIFKQHRVRLLAMGILSGYLGAAPSIVWASGVVFAAAFVVLVPLAMWIYAVVFAFSSLWFGHYCLAALQTLRAQPTDVTSRVVVDSAPHSDSDGAGHRTALQSPSSPTSVG